MRLARSIVASLSLVAVAAPAAGALEPHAAHRTEAAPACGDDRFAAVELLVTPSTLRVSEAALLTFRINVLCAMPTPWRIEVAGRPLASGTNASPPLGPLVIATTWTPTSAGDVTVRAIVDPDNTAGEPEAARVNNVIARALTVAPAPSPIREPEGAPSPSVLPPSPPPPPEPRGEQPGTRGTCTAWERSAAQRGEGLIAVRRARQSPSGPDYVDCGKRLAVEVAKTYCAPGDKKQLAKKPWYLQPGDLALVTQTVECR